MAAGKREELVSLGAPPFEMAHRSFLRGAGPERVSLRFFRRRGEECVVVKVHFGPEAVGPPGCVHGGCIAAVLDEAMGAATWLAGYSVLAARLTVRFRRPVWPESRAVAEAWVERAGRRTVHARARLTAPDGGSLYAEARGTFLAVEPEKLQGKPEGP